MFEYRVETYAVRKAAEEMKTAGIYELVDEYNRQLAEYMAQNGN